MYWKKTSKYLIGMKVNMKESILSLLQTVRLIYSVSKYYNTSERTSSLMVKVNAIRHIIRPH